MWSGPAWMNSPNKRKQPKRLLPEHAALATKKDLALENDPLPPEAHLVAQT